MSRLLHEAGEALYGERWQSDLARDLHISERHMRRLAAGTADVRSGMYLDLLRLTQERAMALDALAERLRAAAAPDHAPPSTAEDGLPTDHD